MELRERIAALRPFPEEHLDDGFAEVRDRVHAEVVAELGPQLAAADVEPAELRARVRAQVRARLAVERGLSAGDRDRLVDEITDDTLGHRADREAAGRRLDLRDHGQRRARRSGSSAAAASSGPACTSATRRICGASSRRSPARWAGVSTSPRRCSTRGSPTAAASTRCSRRCRSPARC